MGHRLPRRPCRRKRKVGCSAGLAMQSWSIHQHPPWAHLPAVGRPHSHPGLPSPSSQALTLPSASCLPLPPLQAADIPADLAAQAATARSVLASLEGPIPGTAGTAGPGLPSASHGRSDVPMQPLPADPAAAAAASTSAQHQLALHQAAAAQHAAAVQYLQYMPAAQLAQGASGPPFYQASSPLAGLGLVGGWVGRLS